jgi:hypothetical protein
MFKKLSAKQKRAYYNQRKYAKIKASPHLYAKAFRKLKKLSH